jgi:tetratricopeptide (TPR) repeat protein
MTRITVAMALVIALSAAAAAAAQDKGPSDDRFQSLMGLARVKRDAGDAASARRYFEDARRLKPFGRDELAEYFWVLAGRDASAAVRVGRDALASAPDNANLRDRVISEALALGDEATVRELAEEGARRHPATALWPRRLADSYLRQGEHDAAAAAFARAVRAADATVDDRAGLALSLEGAKRYAEAAVAWDAVSAAERSGRSDWEHSRLRAAAHGLAAADGAPILDAWLDANSGDDEVRDLLIDLSVRAGDPARALDLLTPAPSGAEGERWLRRRLAIARAAHLNVEAIAAVNELIARNPSRADDRRTLAALLVETRQYEEASSYIRALSFSPGMCDARLLTIADRMPDPFGTDSLRSLLDLPGCRGSLRWTHRAIERLVAASKLEAARVLIDRLPPADRETPAMLRTAGQVHVWTGDLLGGIQLLERALVLTPDDAAARRTLDEAYQARLAPSLGWRADVPLGTGLPLAFLTADAADRGPANASVQALKQRAEQLSWTGHHAEAIRAYDVYLASAPDDVAARRQQARVAGWGGQFDLARRLYTRLQARVPGNAAVAAEASAKSAYYDGRWREAADAYARWIALEPNESEARFERAEALRADGRVSEAEVILADLAASGQHDQAAAALQRARDSRRPSVALTTARRSSDGYDGQRLLDLDEYGGAVRATVGSAGSVVIAANGGRARATGDDGAREGAVFGASATAAVSRAVTMDVRASVWQLARSGADVADARARVDWRPVDRWTVTAGAGQEPLFENLTTVDRALTATGGFFGATFDSPGTWFNVALTRQSVSDGNARTRATLTLSRVLSDRVRSLRFVGWAESLAYRSASADYFSPAHQLRVDAGAEYTFAFSTPRFRGDRQKTLTGGYLIGIDDQGTAYHHPTIRLAFEFARGIAIDADASWIRSRVYRETAAFVGLRFTGAMFAR